MQARQSREAIPFAQEVRSKLDHMKDILDGLKKGVETEKGEEMMRCQFCENVAPISHVEAIQNSCPVCKQPDGYDVIL